MAKARSKTKAKSGSKTAKKAGLKKKPVAAKAKSARAAKKPAKAKKPAPKKVAAKKAAPKKPAPKKVVAKRPVAPAVNRALAQAEIEGLISRLPPPVQPVVKTLRQLVLESAPEASELLEDGAPAYFANGVFARIVPSEREVLVKFLRGNQLPSAAELRDEQDGQIRSLSLSDLGELKESVLRKVVREAVLLNLSLPPAARA